MFKINQRVNTYKYGPGVIVNFEVLGPARAFIVDEYEDGARIGVQLDTPENWPLHAHGMPYFVPRDIA